MAEGFIKCRMFVDYLVLPRYYLVSFEIWNGCRVALWAAGREEEEKQGNVIMLGGVNRWLVVILWGRGELGLDPVCETGGVQEGDDGGGYGGVIFGI